MLLQLISIIIYLQLLHVKFKTISCQKNFSGFYSACGSLRPSVLLTSDSVYCSAYTLGYSHDIVLMTFCQILCLSLKTMGGLFYPPPFLVNTPPRFSEWQKSQIFKVPTYPICSRLFWTMFLPFLNLVYYCLCHLLFCFTTTIDSFSVIFSSLKFMISQP